MKWLWLFALVLILLPSTAIAATCTTNSSGLWENASIWDCGVIPDADDDVIINHTISVTGDGDVICNSMNILATTGHYNATPGVTTIDNWDGASNAFKNLGTLTHNSGTFNFTSSGTGAKVYTPQGYGNFYNVIFEAAASTNSLRFTQYLSVTIEGDLTVKEGIVYTDNSTIVFTVTGDLIIEDGGSFGIDGYSTPYTFGSLTIQSGGIFNATSGDTDIYGPLVNQAGSSGIVHNNGEIEFRNTGSTVNTYWDDAVVYGITKYTTPYNWFWDDLTIEGYHKHYANNYYWFDDADDDVYVDIGTATTGGELGIYGWRFLWNYYHRDGWFNAVNPDYRYNVTWSGGTDGYLSMYPYTTRIWNANLQASTSDRFFHRTTNYYSAIHFANVTLNRRYEDAHQCYHFFDENVEFNKSLKIHGYVWEAPDEELIVNTPESINFTNGQWDAGDINITKWGGALYAEYASRFNFDEGTGFTGTGNISLQGHTPFREDTNVAIYYPSRRYSYMYDTPEYYADGSNWSFAFWWKGENTQVNVQSFIGGTGTRPNLWWYLYAPYDRLRIRTYGNTYYWISTAGQDWENWHHYIIASNSSRHIMVYVDGVLDQTTLVDNNYMVYYVWGRGYSCCAYSSQGWYDNLGVYNVTINASEASDLANDIDVTRGRIHWFEFDNALDYNETAGEIIDDGYLGAGGAYSELYGESGTSLIRLNHTTFNSDDFTLDFDYVQPNDCNNTGDKFVVCINCYDKGGNTGPWIIEELGGEDCEIYGVGNLEEEITCDTAHINSEASITLNSDGIINFNRIVKEPDATLILDGGFFRRR